MMSGVLALAGGVGFLSSVLMLQAGLDRMWLRYPCAVFIGWVAFLGLIRLWAAMEQRVFIPDEEIERLCREGDDPGDVPSQAETTDSLWRQWIEAWNHAPSFDGDGDGCLVWFVLWFGGLLLLIAVAGIYVLVAGAPMLLAEVFLDAILVGALYKRMAQLDRRWWLTGALDRTTIPMLWTVVTLALAGTVMQQVAPDAKSIGGFVRHITGD
jgi:hypothetical protein